MNAYVCAVCADPLEFHTPTGTWLHALELIGESDHPSIPVRPEELARAAGKCDFCASAQATWIFPTSGFADPLIADAEFDENWSACDVCKELVERGWWDDLSERCFEATLGHVPMAPRERDEMLRYTRALHQAFNAHRTGAAARIRRPPAVSPPPGTGAP